ncbi:MAG: hypothetical protein PHH77_01490 [Victivallaceae bacterium]|nr:hypothetical protein [Victivallaceae bacterium]
MRPWIENLLALQQVDMRIINLRLRLKIIPREIDKLNRKIAAAEAQLTEAKNSAQKTAHEIKRTESAIAEINVRIKQLQQQSSLIKKNTEYQAMLSQIDTQKDKISDLETALLLLFDQDEEQREKFRETEKEFKAEKNNVSEEIDELTAQAEEVRTEISRLTARRPPLEAKIEADVLVQYQRLLKSGRLPLAKVNAAGICGNCHLKVTPQTMTETRKETVIHCDNCSCLLYLET